MGVSGAGVHPARQKAGLRRLLAVDQVVTTAQLRRWGLSEAAGWLGLPEVTFTCRTRVTQSESGVDLTFVSLDAETLNLAPRDLLHLAGAAEVRRRLVLGEGESWRHIVTAGRERGSWPDAEIVCPWGERRGVDWGVEVDLGYAPARIREKLRAAALAGYGGLIWGTSIHERTATLPSKIMEWFASGDLPGVQGVLVLFIDVWSERDPYSGRPRCHKPMHAWLRAAEARA